MELPLIAMLLLITLFDLRYHRIPNSYLALMAGMLIAGWIVLGNSQQLLWWQLPLGALTGVTAGFALYLLKLCAAGDGKLFMVLGAWLGPLPILMVIALSVLFAGIQALLYLLYKGQLLALLKSWYQRFILRGEAAISPHCRDRLPMAGAITLATLLQLV